MYKTWWSPIQINEPETNQFDLTILLLILLEPAELERIQIYYVLNTSTLNLYYKMNTIYFKWNR
jgi:hypothetical protein